MICFFAGSLLAAAIPGDGFSLAWIHSVEKIEWREEYRAERGKLRAVAAQVRGSGAGMEPPKGAALRHGIWHYRPQLPPQAELRLTRSEFVADYRICWQGTCRALADLAAAPLVIVRAC